ncbi:hypothetical protein Y032_0001g322 [Ancylostoma ceylanicum]|uniref:Uncharacterized protein n=1 Tax=Ancylostoma ceylanicum TaxID=53326 RepID=A0A016W3S8_9BILA|nr:hypothetical protein Y032_0001g322 [Ancylostoma ceylanicum]
MSRPGCIIEITQGKCTDVRVNINKFTPKVYLFLVFINRFAPKPQGELRDNLYPSIGGWCPVAACIIEITLSERICAE